MPLLQEQTEDTLQRVEPILIEHEKSINALEHAISKYLVKVSRETMSAQTSKELNVCFSMVQRFEKMGDHGVRLFRVLSDIVEEGTVLSERARSNLVGMANKVLELMELLKLHVHSQEDIMSEATPLEEEIDQLRDLYLEEHKERVRNGECEPMDSFSYVDLLSNHVL